MLTVKAMTIIVDSLPPRPKFDYDVGYDVAVKGASVLVSHSLNTESKHIPKQDPMDEVKVASLDDFIEPNLEDDAQFFIKEEDESSIKSKPLDELLEPPKPYHLVLDTLFSIMIRTLL